MPQAAQILDSIHVVAALHEGDRPCEVHTEARACQMAEAMQDVYSCPDRESAAAAPNRLCL
ncbi:hypothetical protein [Atopobium sp. oral taxon 416]|uniref:hypothetical protein n=1 Tax=Atopobium sp. oral taxon 416 TaxID=712157 RepID=UPI001BA44F49|nr:hypothetical protein [Atopobium sp. oral taxon 416]QUC02594.1 hypothetical protein J4859_11205 [Atopobium sp. oral taxon 416]